MKIKKLLLALTLMLSTVLVAQEKGDFNAFAGFSYNEDLAIGGGVEYLITSDISLTAGLNFYFVEKPAGASSASAAELNVNARYYFSKSEKFNWFGVLGYNAVTAKVSVGGISAQNTEHGVNLGVGVLYPLSEKLSILGIARYATTTDIGFVPTVGLQYAF